MSKKNRSAKRVAARCAVLVVVVLTALCTLAGCGSGGNDAALASTVRAAAESSGYASQVRDVTAQGDGSVTISLDPTGSDFKDQTMVALVPNAVLNKVPAVKKLTLKWATTGAEIGVYTAK